MGPNKLQHLRRRLKEAQETLQAIHRGAVDAVVVRGEQGEQVFYLDGADRFYRMTVERMQQGAVSLGRDGTIFYCNQRLAEMLGVPHQRILGQPMLPFVAPASRRCFEELLQNALSANCQGELWLQAADGHEVPVFVAMNPLPLGEVAAFRRHHRSDGTQTARGGSQGEGRWPSRPSNYGCSTKRSNDGWPNGRRWPSGARPVAGAGRRVEPGGAARTPPPGQVLHDHLQQLLVAARLKLGLMQRRAADHAQRIMQVDELLDQAISNRSLTVELSPPISTTPA